MPINREQLTARVFPVIEQRYQPSDCILYALGIGLGQNPLDPGHLRFVYEDNLLVMPTMSVVLGFPGFWWKDPDVGVDPAQVLLGEQWLTQHRPLPTSACIRATTRVLEVVDKGAGRGAVVYTTRDIVDAGTGAVLASVGQSTVCRGEGGFGGPRAWSGAALPQAIPARPPNLIAHFSTRPETALIYRLSADRNPLHVDPAAAHRAGFRRPVMHGLIAYGMACHVLLGAYCEYDCARLKRLDCRFIAPVFPGETITTEIWELSRNRFAFQCKTRERDLVILGNGFAQLAD